MTRCLRGSGNRHVVHQSQGRGDHAKQIGERQRMLCRSTVWLVAFDAPRDGINGCCPAQTPDHIVPKSSFFVKSVDHGKHMPGWENYNIDKAPCMCLEGGSCSGSHGLRSAHHKAFSPVEAGDERAFNDEMKHCAEGAKAIAPQCSQACIEAQLKTRHEDRVIKERRLNIRHPEKITKMIKRFFLTQLMTCCQKPDGKKDDKSVRSSARVCQGCSLAA